MPPKKPQKPTKRTTRTQAKAKAPPKPKPKPKPKSKPAMTRKIDLKPSAAKTARVTKTRPASAKATAGEPAAAPKVTDLKPALTPVLANIPWGYGDVRITAMPRDPHWAFAYWEVTDDAIAAARAKLKDPDASLHLRIYDTTHREFNGLNAHHHWDLGLDRATISYTFRVGRPACTVHVDVGVRSGNGDFMPIARSGACEMPRDSMSPNSNAEWSTVLRNGPGYGYRHKYVAPPPAPHAPAPPAETWTSSPAAFEPVFRHLSGEGWTRQEWTDTQTDGRVFRWIRWSGPFLPDQILPLLPLGEKVTFKNVEVLFQGERRTVKVEGVGERTVYGPWKIQLEAVGPKGEKKTIHQWAVKQRWTTEQGRIRVETPAILTRILGGRKVTAAKGGSEERLAHEAWGSEMMTAGASETLWAGASESLLAGSSETLFMAASESLFLAASQIAERGASEHRWGGASELYGASENRP